MLNNNNYLFKFLFKILRAGNGDILFLDEIWLSAFTCPLNKLTLVLIQPSNKNVFNL